MNRRQFHQALIGALGLWALPRSRARAQRGGELQVNTTSILKRLDELASFGATPEGGVNRVAYSPEDLEARRWVTKLMQTTGLDVHVDFAGNIVGRLQGSQPSLPPLALGSHIDTVPNGGRYDGPLGSLGAIEVAETLRQAGVVTRHPLEVIIFQNEEGGKTGSRALIGALAERDLGRVTHSRKSIREGIELLGGDPTRLEAVRRQKGDLAAFLELHIEQGAVLENKGIDIGVVEGIVGIRRWYVTVEGFANHAGTTPMGDRRDALVAAAHIIAAVDRIARNTPGRQVATVGQIEAFPGAPNVIAGGARMSLEIRDLEMEKIDRVFETIRTEAEAVAKKRNVRLAFDPFYVSEAAPTDERLQAAVEKAAQALGLTTLRMPSGAGHDAQSIAKLAPVGMIFIPSVGGISHSPKELSRPQDILNGVNVLLQTLLAADAML